MFEVKTVRKSLVENLRLTQINDGRLHEKDKGVGSKGPLLQEGADYSCSGQKKSFFPVGRSLGLEGEA